MNEYSKNYLLTYKIKKYIYIQFGVLSTIVEDVWSPLTY